MSKISSNVLDLVNGSSEHVVKVLLEFLAADGWQDLAAGELKANGQFEDLLVSDDSLEVGIYKLSFDVKSYMLAIGQRAPYPYIPIVFDLDADRDYEISLMLGASGFSSTISVNDPA